MRKNPQNYFQIGTNDIPDLIDVEFYAQQWKMPEVEVYTIVSGLFPDLELRGQKCRMLRFDRWLQKFC